VWEISLKVRAAMPNKEMPDLGDIAVKKKNHSHTTNQKGESERKKNGREETKKGPGGGKQKTSPTQSCIAKAEGNRQVNIMVHTIRRGKRVARFQLSS